MTTHWGLPWFTRKWTQFAWWKLAEFCMRRAANARGHVVVRSMRYAVADMRVGDMNVRVAAWRDGSAPEQVRFEADQELDGRLSAERERTRFLEAENANRRTMVAALVKSLQRERGRYHAAGRGVP